MTVDALVEIDKLIQLLESPIFSCKFPIHKNTTKPKKNFLYSSKNSPFIPFKIK